MSGFCGFSGCGEYGKCSFNDTCACEPGYFGHLCQNTREYIILSSEVAKCLQIQLYIIHLGTIFDPRLKTKTLVSYFDSTSFGEFYLFQLSAT